MTFRAILAASVLSLGFSSAALGVPLQFTTPPYTDTTLPGTTVVDRPELAGVVLRHRLVPYLVGSGGSQASGNIMERVVRENISGTLDFYWSIQGDGQGPPAVTTFRVDDFAGYVSDGDRLLDGIGNEGPATARNFGNGAVNFLFDSGIANDDSSNIYFLRTSATRYSNTGRYDLLSDAGSTGLFSTFAPAAVPEPGQGVMIIGGLTIVGMGGRRRASAAALCA